MAQFYLFLFTPVNLVHGYFFCCCCKTLLTAFFLLQIPLTHLNRQTDPLEPLISSHSHASISSELCLVSSNLKLFLSTTEFSEIHPHHTGLLPLHSTILVISCVIYSVESILCRSDQNPVFFLLPSDCLGPEPLHVLQTLHNRKCTQQDKLLRSSRDLKTKPAPVDQRKPKKKQCSAQEPSSGNEHG